MTARRDGRPKRQPAPRVPRLACIADIRAELCRVYRELRHGRLEAPLAMKLTHVLSTLARLDELTRIEIGMAEMEERDARQQAVRPNYGGHWA